MDINTQNFDAGAVAFVDDQYSNFSLASVGNPTNLIIGMKQGQSVPEIKKSRFRPNPKQQMWIAAFRRKNKEVNILSEKLKIAVIQGNKNQKTAYENQIQSILSELKQLKAQNEELLKKNSTEAVPKEVLVEQEVEAKTPYDSVPANIDESAPVKSDEVQTNVEQVTETTSNKKNWILPVLGIGIIAYFIFKK